MNMTRTSRDTPWLQVALAVALVLPTFASAQDQIDIERPEARQFILDKASLLDSQAAESIRNIADELLTDRATPIIVVTIDSMAAHGGVGMRIETFARILFDQWQIGHATIGKEEVPWNTGILLLVSRDDRKARIELGAGWGRKKDGVTKQIMDRRIIPKFKHGDFSAGIEAGVDALDSMAREKSLPRVPRPWSHYAMIVGFFGLAIFTIVSLVRRQSSGWAWLFWGGVFSVLGFVLYNAMRSRSGGGGFGGGSFGGGFSGGGGASGSW